MDETVCNIELSKGPRFYIGTVSYADGEIREFKSENFDEVLEQIAVDVQEEYEKHQS
jgi:hypothetical protein